MTRRDASGPAIVDMVALAAIAWVAAATLHEGLGHGAACMAMGGRPIAWTTFHFECARQSMSAAAWRIVAGAGTTVNLGLMVIGWLWWRHGDGATARLAAWIMFAVNGLTSFGYLIFSAAFGIGDWNGTGVMAGVADAAMARGGLAVVGVAGYGLIVRMGAGMLSRMPIGSDAVKDARRLSVTVWITTGAISLLAALAAGGEWRATLGASIGVALGGNAGLLSVARFMAPSTVPRSSPMVGRPLLRAAAVAAVVAFVAILGPGVRM